MDNCPICYQKIMTEFVILNCGCNYIYHSKCIRKWFEKKKSCPTCRKLWGAKKNSKIENRERLMEIGRRIFLESIGRNSSSRLDYYRF